MNCKVITFTLQSRFVLVRFSCTWAANSDAEVEFAAREYYRKKNLQVDRLLLVWDSCINVNTFKRVYVEQSSYMNLDNCILYKQLLKKIHFKTELLYILNNTISTFILIYLWQSYKRYNFKGMSKILFLYAVFYRYANHCVLSPMFQTINRSKITVIFFIL